jgi:hypothetical protein
LRTGTAALLAACVLAAAAFAATHALSASKPHASAPAPNPDSLIHGARLQSARCSNWLAASAADKALAVRALTAAVGGPTEFKGVRGTTLTEAESYALLNNACSSPIAKHFLLYELYIRAAGFRSLWAGQP